MTSSAAIGNGRVADADKLAADASVGVALMHDSAVRHVRGTAAYVDDVAEPAGTLHLAPGYAACARGIIRSMDLAAVRAAPGVIAVLTASDIPGVNDCSPASGDDPILCNGTIRFHGDVIFVVVAKTRAAARRAARLAKIEFDELAPRVDVADGLRDGAEVLPPYEFVRGDPSAIIEQAANRLEARLRIGGQEHFYLEGQVALAMPGEGNEMWVLTSTQHPSEVQHLIARMLGVADAAVICECRRMGGAFGGKESQAAQWACLAALAARITGCTAKLRLDRDDDMIMTGKRHDCAVEYRCATDEDARITALEVTFDSRCGCSADLSMGINDRTMFHADNTYFYPAVRIHSRRVRTDTVSNTAFRGFGGPQGMLFAERMMDAIAITRGLDPLMVRKRNLYARGRDITPYGMRVDDHIARRLIRQLERSSEYAKRRKAIVRFNRNSPIVRKGIALTPVKFGIAFTLKHLNQAGALVNVFTDGSVQVNHGGTEMGQGLYIKVAQVVAEEFGIDVSCVHITATRTDKVPNTAPTAASAGSDLNGMAARRAAATIRDRLAELAARIHQVRKSEVVFRGGMVHAGQQSMPFEELTRLAFTERVSMSSTGYYATPKITWNRNTASGRPFHYFAYGAACTEVTVDTLTGEMRVVRVDLLHDVGHSLNPAIDIGQIEGGFVQGMGWLTSEELVFDTRARLLSHAPSTYKIPTCSDVPDDFRVALWESRGNREATIHRSKAVGEPPLMLAISVFSAITHAIASLTPGRVPPLDAPATPESILRAVNAMRGEQSH